MRWTATTLALSLALVIGLTGCGKTEEDSSNETGMNTDTTAPVLKVQFVNSTCPILGNPVVADAGSAEFNSQTIGFCCPKCAGKWDEKSGEEKQAFLDKILAAKAAETGAPESGGGG